MQDGKMSTFVNTGIRRDWIIIKSGSHKPNLQKIREQTKGA